MLIILPTLGRAGNIYAGGNPGEVKPAKPKAIAISAGWNHTCALVSGGAVKCGGENKFGQFGDGSNENRNTPVEVSGLSAGVESISVGKSHSCARLTGGSGQCWGAHGEGQLGDGTNLNESVPVWGLNQRKNGLDAGPAFCITVRRGRG